MKRIERRVANRLVGTGAAGWYALDANPPIPHPTQTVVTVGESHYLCTPDEITVTPTDKIVLINNVPKQTFAVTIKDDSALARLLFAELATKPALEHADGTGLPPTFHTGDRKAP